MARHPDRTPRDPLRPRARRSPSSASARASARGTRCSRARPAPIRRAAPRSARPTARLPYIAAMGFDVLYLPPIHPDRPQLPQGPQQLARRRRRTTPAARGRSAARPAATTPSSPGSARSTTSIGSSPAARRHRPRDRARPRVPGLARSSVRPRAPRVVPASPDGTIKYAENPPKKYQDIYPINFESEQWQALWRELKRIIVFWIAHGVKIFRVDNPHTKPFRFWEWALADVKREHPDTIFLSEAFTRPKVMRYLAKSGFSQSYTYFTWRNSEGGAERVLHRADAHRRARVHAAEPLREHAGHPARVPAARRPAGVRGPADPRGDARRQLRHLQRLRAVPRTCRSSRAARSTSTPRSTRSGSATSTQPHSLAELIAQST